MPSLLDKTVSGLLSRVDTWERAPAVAPDPREDLSPRRVEPGRWDLRTLIAVFGPGAPFRFLNLNFVTGLTGLPFDRPDRLGKIDPRAAFDLQVCLEGRTRHASHKGYHALAAPNGEGAVAGAVELQPFLRFAGTWPDYGVEVWLPEEELSLSLKLHSREGFHWWARNPGLYSHYTSFAAASMSWRWGRQSGELSAPLLHDHGWGRNFGPIGRGLQLFRYEVLRLPDDAYLILLICDGPGGVHLRHAAIHRRLDGRTRRLELRAFEVISWDELPNYRGEARRLPRRWRTVLGEGALEFQLTGERAGEPRPLLGDGFLQAQDFRADGALLSSLGLTGSVTGEGYVEQMGRP